MCRFSCLSLQELKRFSLVLEYKVCQKALFLCLPIQLLASLYRSLYLPPEENALSEQDNRGIGG